MRYIYGNENYNLPKGKTIPVKQLASLIKRDVEVGKWNIYNGGDKNHHSAKCKYEKNGFTYHEELLIFGSEEEFKKLEELLKGIIEIIPRKFN